MAELISLNPYQPDGWLMDQAARIIDNGGVAVVPTDTVYAIVCSVKKRNAADLLHRLKGPAESSQGKPLSVIFDELSTVAKYTKGIPNLAYRAMRRGLPGPFTFILKASKRIPAAALQGRKTIGVRIPGHPVCIALLERLSAPLLATSVQHDNDDDPLDDPIEISTRFGNAVDLVVDAGPIYPEPSTVIDFSTGVAEVLREGKGDIDQI